MTFPSTSASIARTDAGQTFTGVQVMTSPTFLGSPTAPTQAEGDTSTKLATDEFVSRAINSAIFHSDTKSITITQTTVTGVSYHCLSTDYTVAFMADTTEEPTIYLPTTVGNNGRIICCANISAFCNSTYAVRIVPDDTNTEHLMWSDSNIIRLGSGYECVTLQCHRGQSTGYWVIIGKGF